MNGAGSVCGVRISRILCRDRNARADQCQAYNRRSDGLGFAMSIGVVLIAWLYGIPQPHAKTMAELNTSAKDSKPSAMRREGVAPNASRNLDCVQHYRWSRCLPTRDRDLSLQARAGAYAVNECSGRA